MRRDLEAVVGKLLRSEYGVVFTGAGISVASGIHTFRGTDGLWSRYDPRMVATIRGFRSDPAAFWRFARELTGSGEVQPNPGHRALAELERLGCVDRVITQNIDGLHQRAGSQGVVELHGTLARVDCLDCGAEFDWEGVTGGLEEGDEPPLCPRCSGGMLKPDIVFFGEELPADELSRARAAAGECDLFMAVGTSMEVYPAAGLPELACGHGAALVLVNPEPTSCDWLFDIVLRGRAEEILPALARGVRSAL